MKPLIRSGLFLISIFLVGGCAAQQNSLQMVKAAKALDQDFVQQFNNQNVDGVMADYWNSEYLTVYSPTSQAMSGWEDERDDFVKEFASMPGAKLEMTDSNYMASGEVVIGWGTWKLTMPGAPADIPGRYTEIIANKDGKWVYIIDHASTPMAMAAAQPAASK